MVDENYLIAAHEVGHQLIGKARGLAITTISIRRGRELNPVASYDPTQPMPTDDQMLEILLAGWAGEAYILSHPRHCQHFDTRLFLAKIPDGRSGTGWPWALLTGGGSDFGRISRLRGKRLRALFPNRILTTIAGEIHDKRDRFFEIVDRLVDQKLLTADVFNALADGENWSIEMQQQSVSANYDHDLKYFYPKDQLSD